MEADGKHEINKMQQNKKDFVTEFVKSSISEVVPGNSFTFPIGQRYTATRLLQPAVINNIVLICKPETIQGMTCTCFQKTGSKGMFCIATPKKATGSNCFFLKSTKAALDHKHQSIYTPITV